LRKGKPLVQSASQGGSSKAARVQIEKFIGGYVCDYQSIITPEKTKYLTKIYIAQTATFGSWENPNLNSRCRKNTLVKSLEKRPHTTHVYGSLKNPHLPC